MKVKELVVLLQQHDQEAEVQTEGCDCIGEPDGVVTLEEFYSRGRYASNHEGDKNVIITRGDYKERG